MCRKPLYAIKLGTNPSGKDHLKIYGRTDQDYLGLCNTYGKENVVALPCGHCKECLNQRAKNWASRGLLEASEFKNNCFITLTYNNKCVPKTGLSKRDIQLFMKRLRKKYGDGIRYLFAGEYGPKTLRPHYHAIIFNWFPEDSKPYCKGKNGGVVYHSKSLNELWNKGFCELSDVNFNDIAYVARYCVKKANPVDLSILGYSKEFILMSRKPGLGYNYFIKNINKIIDYDKLFLNYNGFKKVAVPRYFDKLIEKYNPSLYKTLKLNRQYLGELTNSARNLLRGKINHEEFNKARAIDSIKKIDKLKREAF